VRSPRERRDELVSVAAGIHRIGHDGESFSFDNETPAHRVYVDEFSLADRLVTNADWLAFIHDRGYHRPSSGCRTVGDSAGRQLGSAVLPGARRDGWTEFTLAGVNPVDPGAPVCHVSYYEADAFARWAGARLPPRPNGKSPRAMSPCTARSSMRATSIRLRLDRRETVRCASCTATCGSGRRAPTPPIRLRAIGGALGEYNGKWMCDQWVLRGASCATPRSTRVTYRNFFPSDARWQFMGLRLAKNA
jgi:formylglycine-generating enzyme required for sulfatase activity